MRGIQTADVAVHVPLADLVGAAFLDWPSVRGQVGGLRRSSNREARAVYFSRRMICAGQTRRGPAARQNADCRAADQRSDQTVAKLLSSTNSDRNRIPDKRSQFR